MAQVDRLIGTAIGNYTIASRLGAGGMGQVYEAVQPAIGARVAIKVLHADASDPTTARRFLREAQAVNKIDHDGVAKIIDAGYTADGRPYLVMEFLDGVSLAEVTAGGTKLPLGTACKVMSDVLGVLGAAHAEGIVHRDLKPHNIFLTRSGRTVVLDFGVAKLLEADAPVSLTLTGAIVGTPAYMAPEQIQGEAVDGRADLYAVGVVLYELVTGRRPFEADQTGELLHAHVARRPPPPRAIRPDVPEAIQAVLISALAKEPDDRFQAAEAMRSALLQAAVGLPVGPVPLPARKERPNTRPPAEAPTRPLRAPSADDAAPTRNARPGFAGGPGRSPGGPRSNAEGVAQYDERPRTEDSAALAATRLVIATDTGASTSSSAPPPGASSAVPRSRRPVVIVAILAVIGIGVAFAVGMALGRGGGERRSDPTPTAAPIEADATPIGRVVGSAALLRDAAPATADQPPLEDLDQLPLAPPIDERLLRRRLHPADLPPHAIELLRRADVGAQRQLARLIEQLPIDETLIDRKMDRIRERVAGLRLVRDAELRDIANRNVRFAEEYRRDGDLLAANERLFTAEWWLTRRTTPPW